MRKGRFASISGNPEMVAPLSPADLLLVDVLAADGQYDERIGTERVRTLTLAVTYGAHPEAGLRACDPLLCIADVASLRTWLNANA